MFNYNSLPIHDFKSMDTLLPKYSIPVAFLSLRMIRNAFAFLKTQVTPHTSVQRSTSVYEHFFLIGDAGSLQIAGSLF